MAIRHVQIADPGRYTPAAIRSIRHKLSLTQRLFAALIGVSVELVEHWEQGRREPGTLARRLLDEIARDPHRWQAMVRRSA
jgi:putative transcriptional regulator